MTGKCVYCGSEFEQHTRRHIYCSGRCKEAARVAKLDLHQGTCKGCGKPITFKLKAGRPTRQYCCASCQVAHTIPTKILTCVDCGKQFEFHGRTTKLRCDECWHKHRSISVMAERALKDNSVQIGVGSGGNQNIDVDMTPEERSALNESRRVYYANNRDRMRAIARSRYRKKALSVYSSCEICGYDKIDALIVHHKDMDRANDSEDNLIVLCANCHMRLHKLIKTKQKTHQITAAAVFDLFKEAELKERKQPETPDKAIRPEGCEESQSGATHSDTSRTDMSHQEAVPVFNTEKIC